MRRLSEFVRSLHQDALPVGLLVPFDVAWKTVEDFLESDGAWPGSIGWIDACNLPPDTFLDQHDPKIEERLVRD